MAMLVGHSHHATPCPITSCSRVEWLRLLEVALLAVPRPAGGAALEARASSSLSETFRLTSSLGCAETASSAAAAAFAAAASRAVAAAELPRCEASRLISRTSGVRPKRKRARPH